MNALTNLLRNVVILMLALAGLAMAFVFMVATAIALGVLYIVARVRGKPFAPAAFWSARRSNMQWHFTRAAPGQRPEAPFAANKSRAARNDKVIDVEVRELP